MMTHLWAVADHRPRTGETIALETGERVLITRGMEPQPGWKRPPITCKAVYAGDEDGVSLNVLVRIQGWRA